MTPREISDLKKHYWRVKVAIESKDLKTLRSLRDHVTASFEHNSLTCGRCGEFSYPTLMSPYNAANPGWCANCVIIAFHTPNMPRLPKSEYEYVEHFLNRHASNDIGYFGRIL